MTEAGALRIGELSRRSGVSPELLRAWERRYGLLQPTRSPGGLRLYSPDDLARVQAMQQHLAEGLAAAEAAALATSTATGDEASTPARRTSLPLRCRASTRVRSTPPSTRCSRGCSLDALLREVVIPYLHELGERWERGEVSVAQEHFASTLLRGRLLGLARGWGRGLGPGRSPRVRPGRTARSRPARLRTRAARARLADRLPRHRYPDRERRRCGARHAPRRRRRQRSRSPRIFGATPRSFGNSPATPVSASAGPAPQRRTWTRTCSG